MNLRQIYEGVEPRHYVTAFVSIFSWVCPGLLLIVLYFPGFIKDLDVLKTIFLSAALTAPYYFTSLFASIVVEKFEAVRNPGDPMPKWFFMLLAEAVCAAKVYILIAGAFLNDWTLRMFVSSSVTVEIVWVVVIAGAALWLKRKGMWDEDKIPSPGAEPRQDLGDVRE